jgi:hypothetical protein
MTGRNDGSTVDALALLPLPQLLHLLTADQLRGADCVWCYERLNTATAYDLGTQTGTINGVIDSLWYPRACPGCVGQKARKAYYEHSQSCEQCVDDSTLCSEQQALRVLSRRVGRLL